MKNIMPINYVNDINVVKIEDLSDDRIKRERIHFKNGYALSVIIGVEPEMARTNGARYGLFEIAVIDKDGRLMYIEDNGCFDKSIGNCDIATVQEWIKKVGEYA